MLQGIYSPYLVAISMLVAILAAYTALDMAERVRTAPDSRSANFWLIGGAFAMGFGIWSMHFIGMLAFELPIAVGYDIAMTAGSLAIAVASSALALKLVSLPELPPLRLALGSVLMGGGIAAMHYLGMAAMRMSPGILFSSGWVALSLVIAVGASGAALWLQFSIRADTVQARFMRLVASLVMGLAIVGMHYTGMHAANFPLWSVCMAASEGLETGALAAVVTVVSISVLSIALVIAVLDARLASRTSMLASSLAQANQKLIQLALHDNLTRLPNRVLLQDRLEQMLEKAARRKLRFAVMFMDLDGFKSVNDAYGHHAGDQLLSKIGSRLQDALRARDTIARIGGDEFVTIVEIDEPTDAAETAERLVRVVDQSVQVVGHPVRVTASIGISLYPDDGTTAHGLLSNADAAMYHTKRASGNGYRFFEASMNANAQQQLELLSDLRAARENGELMLQYQPKFMAPEGPIRGFEALLRWRHPKRGMVGPDVFIPLAEKNGLIVSIGEWVLNEACRQMRAWRDAGYGDWTIAVNLSPVQFAHEQLVDLVSKTLARHDLPASCLVLEVTEATAMRDTTASLKVLRQLSDLGVSISIDDFGTGYSSLLYLKRLPATELKIDRGFVRELGEGTEDAVIVSAIIALAQKLKLQVVAEGVETAAQQVFLTKAGCDQLQGYLLSRPMNGSDVLAMAG